MWCVRKPVVDVTRQGLAIVLASAFLVQQSVQAATPPVVLPSGGAYTAGAGSIKTSGNAVTINQATLRGVIDWNTFSLGQGGTVTFKNGAGATLNRVNGGQMSSILGSLIASGSVYLINPEGVLLGPGARVHTGGDFLASTLNVSNQAFMQGGALTFTGDSKAVVVNLGDVFSQNGSVFLIGNTVANGGRISAANGTAGLAAGQQVLLKDSTGDQRVFVQGPGGDVTNKGTIAAAQAELKAKGGNVYALAGNTGGQISATGTAQIDGKAWLIADGGKTQVAGTVTAKNADGTGGAIETSGHDLDISHATVNTGQGGNWLLDPVDVLIDTAAATTIQNSLASSNVTVQTTATGASGPGTQSSGSGDINVSSNIAWSSSNSLTLSAYRNVNVNNGATISNSGTGNLTLYSDNAATGNGTVAFNGTGNVHFTGNGNISIYYHPSTFPTYNSYSTSVTHGGGQLTSYMTIDSVADLQNATVASANYAVNKDLNLSSISNFTPLTLLSGYTFDGQSHTISHLTENVSTQYSAAFGGLFGAMSGTVQNVALTGESITAVSSGNEARVGGLVQV